MKTATQMTKIEKTEKIAQIQKTIDRLLWSCMMGPMSRSVRSQLTACEASLAAVKAMKVSRTV